MFRKQTTDQTHSLEQGKRSPRFRSGIDAGSKTDAQKRLSVAQAYLYERGSGGADLRPWAVFATCQRQAINLLSLHTLLSLKSKENDHIRFIPRKISQQREAN